MPNKSRRGRKRGGKQSTETKPKPEKIPVRTLAKRGRKRGRKRKTDPKPPEMVDSSTSTTPAPVPSTSDDYEYKYSKILQFLTVSSNCNEDMFSRAYVKPTASLSEFLFAEEDKSDIDIDATDSELIDIRCCENTSSDLLPLKPTTSFEETINQYIKSISCDKEEESAVTSAIANAIAGASGEKKEMSQEEDNKEKVEETERTKEQREDGDGEKLRKEEGTSRTVAKSVVPKKRNPSRRPRRERRRMQSVSPCRRNRVTESQDAARLRDLERRIAEGQDVSISDIRFYRKMTVKEVKKERKRPVFNPHVNYQSFWAMIETNTRISLDRYHYDRYFMTQYDHLNSFRTRILGPKEQYFCFLSPYTKRILKPFIMWDNETTPMWLRMMDELPRKANKKNPTWEPPQRASIDHCYARPHHLPAMNSLADLYFRPGINHFTCVVFNKKLLIGFIIAFLDFFGNDIYIKFMVIRTEWQSSGIGSIVLYHVIGSSKGRDLTLHVSPKNPALILYQGFGFKVLFFEKNFYSRYLPRDSNQCRHAFYMAKLYFLHKSEDFLKK